MIQSVVQVLWGCVCVGGLISKQVINWGRCLVVVVLELLMGNAVHGVLLVLHAILGFILCPVTDCGSEDLKTF